MGFAYLEELYHEFPLFLFFLIWDFFILFIIIFWEELYQGISIVLILPCMGFVYL